MDPQSDKMPPFLRGLLENPPRAGDGIHVWLFKVSRHLHAHLPAGEIVALLEKAVAGCGRLVPHREIVSAVRDALPYAWQSKGGTITGQSAQKWPRTNAGQRAAIVRNGGQLADLWEISIPRIEDNAPHTEEIVDVLFPGNPLLCCGWTQSEFDTKPREDWRGQLANLALIVPSPMLETTGRTKDGRQSKHTLANTGARRFLVCEFDYGTIDDQAALLLHLGTVAPLVCVVHSGSKSLHGWFFVHRQPERKVEKLCRYAVSLGADRATWTRSQFVRMPDGTRDNGNCQSVFFLNFKPLNTAHDRID